MRLIDADVLPVVTLTDGGYWTKDVIYKSDVDATPTVDAVEVVRCQNCRYGVDDGWLCNYYMRTTFPNSFCSCGEHKSGTQPQREDT